MTWANPPITVWHDVTTAHMCKMFCAKGLR